MTQRERQIMQLIESDPMISQQDLADKLGIARSSVAVHISNLMKKGYIAGKGYVLRSGTYATVVGGVNIDIGGQGFGPLVDRDSNPGKVTMSLGGVGRNIAHNMSLLGLEVRMLTAIGDDLHAQQVAASCSELGIDITHALQVPGGATSTYLYLAGPDGDMALAVSDMEICKTITPQYLAANLNILNNSQVVVVDTNIPQRSLEYLANNCTAPIFCDPVSQPKAEKLSTILGKLHTLKPNRLEAELLSGVPIHDAEDAKRAAEVLLKTGMHRVFISLGSDGVLAADREKMLHLPCCPAQVVNATGAGDAFMAGLVWAYLTGTDLAGSAKAGLAAAAVALEGRETINSNLSVPTIRAKMAEFK